MDLTPMTREFSRSLSSQRGLSHKLAKVMLVFLVLNLACVVDATSIDPPSFSLQSISLGFAQNSRFMMMPGDSPSQSAPSSLSTSTSWTSLGPSGFQKCGLINPYGSVVTSWGTCSGQVTAISLDLVHPGTIYVGAASGGVWKSINSGATWTPPSPRVWSTLLSPSAPSQ
jgi:hypothetical protein